MKKFTLAACLAFTYGTVYALPLGNPGDTSLYLGGVWWEGNELEDSCWNLCSEFSFRSGFYGNYVFDRHLEKKDGGDLENFSLQTNAQYMALNFRDCIDIFATLGVTNMYLRSNANNWTPGSFFESEFIFRHHFSWSVGGRATLWQNECWLLGVEGEYFRVNTEVDYFVDFETGTKTYFDENNKANYREWQFGVGLAYCIATNCPTVALTPYLGLKWSRADMDADPLAFVDFSSGREFLFANLESQKRWGWVLGMTLGLWKMVGVTVEGRWANEKALHINSQIRF